MSSGHGWDNGPVRFTNVSEVVWQAHNGARVGSTRGGPVPPRIGRARAATAERARVLQVPAKRRQPTQQATRVCAAALPSDPRAVVEPDPEWRRFRAPGLRLAGATDRGNRSQRRARAGAARSSEPSGTLAKGPIQASIARPAAEAPAVTPSASGYRLRSGLQQRPCRRPSGRYAPSQRRIRCSRQRPSPRRRPPPGRLLRVSRRRPKDRVTRRPHQSPSRQ